MLGNILEISGKTSKGGRVPVRIALLKIHDAATETNKNGLHWKEEYVKNAIASVKMMPICASFCDEDKTVPLDHGLTGEFVNSDGLKEPLFENSEAVGCFENGTIEEIDINGETIKALVGNGYFFVQRYPAFVSWVRKNHALNKVDTSIEIVGLPSNNNEIVYEEDNPTEEFRTPKEFLFSSSCVISVQPADDNAIVLEVAQKKENKEENTQMEFNMDEIKSAIHSTISELNDKSKTYEDQIAELNSVIEAKDTELADKDAKISELNASVEQLQATLDKLNNDQRTYWEEREILEKELAKAKVAEKLAELDTTLEEFNADEQEVAREDIDKLKSEINAAEKKDDLENVTSEINSIKSKICMNIVEQQKKAASEAKIAEQNSAKEDTVEDIFSEMCEEKKDTSDEDVNIF